MSVAKIKTNNKKQISFSLAVCEIKYHHITFKKALPKIVSLEH